MKIRTTAAATLLTLPALTIPVTLAAPAAATPCAERGPLQSIATWPYAIRGKATFTVEFQKQANCIARLRMSVRPPKGRTLNCQLGRIRGWRLNPSSVYGYNGGTRTVSCSKYKRTGWSSGWHYFTPHGSDGCFNMSVVMDVTANSDPSIHTPLVCW